MGRKYATWVIIISYRDHMGGECVIENRLPLRFLFGDDVLAQLVLVKPVTCGKDLSNKKRKLPNAELNWTKHSIVFLNYHKIGRAHV